MAYNGYLIKIGTNSTFFNKYIKASSYKVTRNTLDIDSYRDANGVLHRNAMEHFSYTITFDVKPLNNRRMQEFMSAIRSNFISVVEKKVNIEFYLPELDRYDNSDFYMPDIDFQINHIEGNEIMFDELAIKFVGY